MSRPIELEDPPEQEDPTSIRCPKCETSFNPTISIANTKTICPTCQHEFYAAAVLTDEQWDLLSENPPVICVRKGCYNNVMDDSNYCETHKPRKQQCQVCRDQMPLGCGIAIAFAITVVFCIIFYFVGHSYGIHHMKEEAVFNNAGEWETEKSLNGLGKPNGGYKVIFKWLTEPKENENGS